MKKLFDIKKLRLYIWIGLAALILGLLVDAAKYHDSSFPKRALNHIWKNVFVIFINYFFFEFAVPKLSRKKLFSSLVRVLFYFILYTAGFLIWRGIGVALHTYLPLNDHYNTDAANGSFVGESIGSFFFFGIIRPSNC